MKLNLYKIRIEYLSTCCGAYSFCDIDEDTRFDKMDYFPDNKICKIPVRTGICGQCKEDAEFYTEDEWNKLEESYDLRKENK